MSRDANAPIDITAKEYRAFEQRSDVVMFCRSMDNATDSKERTRFRSRVNNLLRTLSQLQLEKNKAEYFKRVDYLRVKGISTDKAYLSDNNSSPLSLAPTTAIISRLLKSSVEQRVVDCNAHSRLYIYALLGYLTNAPVTTRGKGEVEEDEEEKKTGYQMIRLN